MQTLYIWSQYGLLFPLPTDHGECLTTSPSQTDIGSYWEGCGFPPKNKDMSSRCLHPHLLLRRGPYGHCLKMSKHKIIRHWTVFYFFIDMVTFIILLLYLSPPPPWVKLSLLYENLWIALEKLLETYISWTAKYWDLLGVFLFSFIFLEIGACIICSSRSP